MDSENKIKLEQDFDFTIRVQGKEILAHRSVLSKHSDYYKAMLTHDTVERETGVVEMKDVAFETVKACIDSLYGMEVIISTENYQEFLPVASFMQLTGILNKTSKFLQSSVDLKSLFEVRNIGVTYFLEDLIEFCDKFALENLEFIAQDPEFNHFNIELLSSLLVAKESVHPKREDSKLTIIVNWVRADEENRKEHLEVLLGLVKLSEISKPYLKYLLLSEKLISESERCMSMLSSAGFEITQLINDNNILGKQAEIRFQVKANAIVLPHSERKENSLFAYHPEERTCIPFCLKPPNWGEVHDIVASEDYFYLYMVFEHGRVFRMDMREDNLQWTKMKNMLCGHGWALRAALHDDFIYVVGSYCAERYSVTNDEWSAVQGRRDYLNGCAVVVCEGFLHTIGEYGRRGEGRKEVQRMCTKTMNWSVLEPMRVARFSPKAAVYGKDIYVVGGTHHSGNFIECYNHDLGSWTKLTAPQIIARSYVVDICIYEKQLFCINSSVIKSYDVRSKQWIDGVIDVAVSVTNCSINQPMFVPFQTGDK